MNIASIRNRMLHEATESVDSTLNTMDIAGDWKIGAPLILLEGNEYLVVCKNDDSIYLTEGGFP